MEKEAHGKELGPNLLRNSVHVPAEDLRSLPPFTNIEAGSLSGYKDYFSNVVSVLCLQLGLAGTLGEI